MNADRPGRIRCAVRFAGSLLDGLRRLLLNLALLGLLATLLVLWFASRPIEVPDGAALRVAPEGALVEAAIVDRPLRLLQVGAKSPHQASLPDLVEAIDAARDDPRIKLLVIETDRLEQSGIAKLQVLREAVRRFRESGKPVQAWGRRFEQGQYLLASSADTVWMPSDGFVLLTGLARTTTYFKRALDQLGIRVHVFRVGEWKSFVEPFTREDMSERDRAASIRLLDGAWVELRDAVAASRKLAPAEIDAHARDYRRRLEAAGGDTAKMALDARLIDGLRDREEWLDELRKQVGAGEHGHDYRHVEVDDYLAAVRAAREELPEKIAVLVAQGAIMDGEQPPGSVGGETFSRLIREAREDDSVKALVLRIDSPGGSAWASEEIRRELDRTRRSGKPVLVSMGAVAASGGYWIATGSDEIWAEPATLTGSIGIFAIFPEFAQPLSRLGLTAERVATAPLAGAADPRLPLSDDAGAAFQLAIRDGYQRFIARVAAARKLAPAAVESIAQGQVWLGTEAKANGLVDQLGSLDRAIAAAAARAGVERYAVSRRAPELPAADRLLRRVLDAALPSGSATPSALGATLAALEREAAALLRWNDPQHLYAHCLCEPQ